MSEQGLQDLVKFKEEVGELLENVAQQAMVAENATDAHNLVVDILEFLEKHDMPHVGVEALLAEEDEDDGVEPDEEEEEKES